MRRRLAVMAAVLTTMTCPGRAAADPFCCGVQGPPLVGDYLRADVVALGRFTNAARADNASGGTTDLHLDTIFKSHRTLGEKKSVTVDRYLPNARGSYLVFADVLPTGKVQPYRVAPATSGALLDYFTGALKVKDRPLAERLRYAFDYLNHAEESIALDAFSEYARSSYREYRDLAKKLPAETIVGWLRDPKTPMYRYGLLGLLLGECGTARHAAAVRALLDEPRKRPPAGVDGLLAGYLMLDVKAAWPYVRGLLADGKGDFPVRYSAVRTVRFVWDQRPDLVPREQLVTAAAQVLEHADMADFVIEDLRKWKRWELCGRVLGLLGRESHSVSVIQRAVLRYALQCPAPAAVAFVREQRRLDPEAVADAEELLRIESEPPASKGQGPPP